MVGSRVVISLLLALSLSLQGSSGFLLGPGNRFLAPVSHVVSPQVEKIQNFLAATEIQISPGMAQRIAGQIEALYQIYRNCPLSGSAEAFRAALELKIVPLLEQFNRELEKADLHYLHRVILETTPDGETIPRINLLLLKLKLVPPGGIFNTGIVFDEKGWKTAALFKSSGYLTKNQILGHLVKGAGVKTKKGKKGAKKKEEEPLTPLSFLKMQAEKTTPLLENMTGLNFPIQETSLSVLRQMQQADSLEFFTLPMAGRYPTAFFSGSKIYLHQSLAPFWEEIEQMEDPQQKEEAAWVFFIAVFSTVYFTEHALAVDAATLNLKQGGKKMTAHVSFIRHIAQVDFNALVPKLTEARGITHVARTLTRIQSQDQKLRIRMSVEAFLQLDDLQDSINDLPTFASQIAQIISTRVPYVDEEEPNLSEFVRQLIDKRLDEMERRHKRSTEISRSQVYRLRQDWARIFMEVCSNPDLAVPILPFAQRVYEFRAKLYDMMLTRDPGFLKVGDLDPELLNFLKLYTREMQNPGGYKTVPVLVRKYMEFESRKLRAKGTGDKPTYLAERLYGFLGLYLHNLQIQFMLNPKEENLADPSQDPFVKEVLGFAKTFWAPDSESYTKVMDIYHLNEGIRKLLTQNTKEAREEAFKTARGWFEKQTIWSSPETTIFFTFRDLLVILRQCCLEAGDNTGAAEAERLLEAFFQKTKKGNSENPADFPFIDNHMLLLIEKNELVQARKELKKASFLREKLFEALILNQENQNALALQSLWDYFAETPGPRNQAECTLDLLLTCEKSKKQVADLAYEILDNLPEQKDLLTVGDAELFHYLYLVDPERAYALVKKHLSSGLFQEPHLRALLNCFYARPHSTLRRFSCELLELLKDKPGFEKAKEFLTFKIGQTSGGVWEAIHLIRWHMSRFEIDRVEAEVNQMLRRTQELGQNPKAHEAWRALKKEFDETVKIDELLKGVLKMLREVDPKAGKKPDTRKMAEELTSVADKIEGENKKVVLRVRDALPKLEALCLLAPDGAFYRLAHDPACRFSAEELLALPPALKGRINAVFAEAREKCAAGKKAAAEIHRINTQFEKITFCSVKELWNQVKPMQGDLKSAVSDEEMAAAEKELREIERKIAAREEAVRVASERFNKAVENGDGLAALPEYETLVKMDFTLDGKTRKDAALWRLLHTLKSREEFEEARLGLDVIREDWQTATAKSAEPFFAQVAEQLPLFEKLCRVKEWARLIEAESRIAATLWNFEKAQQDRAEFGRQFAASSVRETPRGFELSGFQNIDGEDEKTVALFAGKEPSPFIMGDAHRILIPLIESFGPSRERRAAPRVKAIPLKAYVILEKVNSDGKSVEFVFPEKVTDEDRKETLKKMTEVAEQAKKLPADFKGARGVLMQRIKANQLLDQSRTMEEIAWRLESGLEKIAERSEEPLKKSDLLSLRASAPHRGLSHLDQMLGLGNKPPEKIDEKVSLRDSCLAEDRSQFAAVQAALASEGPLVVPILGPGGTGKTRVMLELIRQAMANEKAVLVTAPTHTAVDVIAREIMKLNAELPEPIPFVRMGSDLVENSIGQNLDAGFQAELKANWKSRNQKEGTLADAIKKRKGVVVLGTTTGYNEYFLRQYFGAGLNTLENLGKGQTESRVPWDLVIVDEAGKMTKPELFVLLKDMRSSGKLILSGDAAQLPPHPINKSELREMKNVLGEQADIDTIFSDENLDAHLTSMLETLDREGTLPRYPLTRARRSVPLLTALAARVVPSYAGRLFLRDADLAIKETTEQDALEVAAYSSTGSGREGKEPKKNPEDGSSTYNNHEIAEALKRFYYFINLKQGGKPRYKVENEDVFFISPYQAQVNRYDQALRLTAHYFKIKKEKKISDWESLRTLLGDETPAPNYSGIALEKILAALPGEIRFVLRQLEELQKKAGDDWIYPKPEDLAQVQVSGNPFEEGVEHNGNGNGKKPISTSSTLHRIQGGERKVILFSAVRSNADGEIGFFPGKEWPAFVTVGITRAQEKLFVIFDAGTFAAAPRRYAKSFSLPFAQTVSGMFGNLSQFYGEWTEWLGQKNRDAHSWRQKLLQPKGQDPALVGASL